MTTAAITDASPPAPYTMPRSLADPKRSFVTTTGRRFSQGPHVHSRLTVAATIASHSQRCVRT